MRRWRCTDGCNMVLSHIVSLWSGVWYFMALYLQLGILTWWSFSDRKWQDYVYIQCEYKSTKQKIKHLLREENKAYQCAHSVHDITIILLKHLIQRLTCQTIYLKYCNVHDDVIKWKHFPPNWPLCGEFTGQRSCGVFLDRHPNKRLGNQSIRRWFETPSRSLWRHCNVVGCLMGTISYRFDINPVRYQCTYPLNYNKNKTVMSHDRLVF